MHTYTHIQYLCFLASFLVFVIQIYLAFKYWIPLGQITYYYILCFTEYFSSLFCIFIVLPVVLLDSQRQSRNKMKHLRSGITLLVSHCIPVPEKVLTIKETFLTLMTLSEIASPYFQSLPVYITVLSFFGTSLHST